MLLLGVDTSGPQGGLALCRAEGAGFQVLDLVSLAGGTYSAQLIPQLTAMLAGQNFSKFDLKAFAVASGPGSFTGLRVGLSSVKALAEALGQPIGAVSVLEAVAAAAQRQGRVIAVLDAGRKQVYVGEYELSSSRARVVSERLVTNEEFTAAVPSHAAVVTPDQGVAELVKSAQLVARPRADVYARLGLAKILAGEVITPEALEANYIRRSDAEIFAPRTRS